MNETPPSPVRTTARGLPLSALFSVFCRLWAGVLCVSLTNASEVRPGPAEASLEERPLEACVGNYLGRPVFFVNGKPIPPLMYSGTEHGRKTWEDPARRSLKEFSEAGYQIFQTDFWLKYSLDRSGHLEVGAIRRQLRGILDINPKAMVVVRINVSAPQWWLDDNPEERCAVTKPGPGNEQFGGNRAESLASEKYRAFARVQLRHFLEQLKETPEADRIIGIHIGGGVYGEWHYYGLFNEPDASNSMRRRFAEFAADRFRTIAEVNLRWKTSFSDFSDIVVPSYDRRGQVSDGEFRDPRDDQYVIDFYVCLQETISHLVDDLAKIAKEVWPRPVITGVFYGYFYGGFTVGAIAGQNDIETIFRSPHIDYVAGPYFSRSMLGSGMFRSLAESAALNGKIWMTEHDGGTHLGSSGRGDAKFPDIPETEAQTVARMRRNFMYSLTERGGQWWYDFGPRSAGGGWWSTPRLLREAGELLKLSQTLMERPYEKKADVLVVHSMASYYYHRPKISEKATKMANEEFADALLGTGVSYDKIFMMDLGKVDLSGYKLVIFANTTYIGEPERDYIRTQVMAGGRTVVFFYGSGYSDGRRNDPDFISSLTGIQVEKAAVRHTTLETNLNGVDHRVAVDGLLTYFQVVDHAASIVGRYEGGENAAAMKQVGECTSIYFGAPLGRAPGLLQALCKLAGVRVFVEEMLPGDYVSVGGGVIALYTVSGGEKIICPLDGRRRSVSMTPFTTRYFGIGDGSLLLKEDTVN